VIGTLVVDVDVVDGIDQRAGNFLRLALGADLEGSGGWLRWERPARLLTRLGKLVTDFGIGPTSMRTPCGSDSASNTASQERFSRPRFTTAA
jgi:hypothetical protein